MGNEGYELAGMMLLLSTLTRALVANGTISKLDLLAELSRLRLSAHPIVAGQVESLIQNLPDQ